MILTKQKIYIITVITALIFATLGVLVIYPWVSEILSISNDVEYQRLNLKKYSSREENFKELKSEENEIDLTLRNLSESLISRENNLGFIVLLEDLANKTNNKQSIEIVNKSEEDVAVNKNKTTAEPLVQDGLKDIESLHFKIKLEGKYKNLLNYLLELEKLEIYTEVTSISIKLKNVNVDAVSNKPFEEGEAQESDILNTTLEVRVFAREQ